MMFVCTWWSGLRKPGFEGFVDDEVDQMSEGENEHLQVPPYDHQGQVRYRKVSEERGAELQNIPPPTVSRTAIQQGVRL